MSTRYAGVEVNFSDFGRSSPYPFVSTPTSSSSGSSDPNDLSGLSGLDNEKEEDGNLQPETINLAEYDLIDRESARRRKRTAEEGVVTTILSIQM